MRQDLKDLFERALDDEPVLPGHGVAEAMAEGRRIRRRRRALAGGSVAAVVVAAVAGLGLAMPAGHGSVATPAGPDTGRDPARTAVTITIYDHWGAVDGICGFGPSSSLRPQLTIFLANDMTASRRSALEAALRADPLVGDLRFVNAGEAYDVFWKTWGGQAARVVPAPPGYVAASFHLTAADPSSYKAFAAKFGAWAGVLDIKHGDCVGAAR